jgi:chemotaxis signal transduction protein
MRIVSTAPSPTVVTFRVANEELAVSADRVRETLESVRPTRVPGAHAWYDGIQPWRGQLVPVLNVARRLGLAEGEGAAVVVIEAEGEVVGLRVDALAEEAPVVLASLDRPVTLLDPATLLSAPVDNVSTFPAKPGRAPAADQNRKGRAAGNGRRGVKRA